ncbi:N-acetylmuramoyl-L-alanine amidase [Alkalispirochaeta americana]|uniref:N-acetylmuramoyl-L-alanine amidase n=1 Tax=Alkalispirochaeta americana TaxID=159291 RepID=A0A1N6PAK6_9SPIO|nr:N-acetylmuramoyl-L-alanine amidase [Alkalispirochaeta americana]SIQ01428.1 N-acetylmuramoyl-L-alanine amidase [Alkalispirochaeta americana]
MRFRHGVMMVLLGAFLLGGGDLFSPGTRSLNEAAADSRTHRDFSREVSLEDLLERVSAHLEWDPYRGRGSIVRGGRALSFGVGVNYAVENYSRLHAVTPPFRRDGALVFSGGFLDLALRVFPPPDTLRSVGAIFIDPGHGGRDPGAIGRHQFGTELRELREKDLVLDVSLQLRDLLKQRFPEKKIVLSRDDDTYITLEDRTDQANEIPLAPHESVLFVSIHANASLNSRAKGFEVWVLPPEFRRRDLVNPERVGVEDPEVLSILNTMREEEITLESELLARNILSGLDAAVGEESPNRGIREESWYVVRNARMPSVLVEIGFVTNREDFKRLEDPAYLRRITRGIYTGVLNFIENFEEVGRD